MLYHAYKPQTILDFLDLKYSTSTTHHSVDVLVTRGFAADTVNGTIMPDFVHIHVDNTLYGTDFCSTLTEVIRHADDVSVSLLHALEMLHDAQLAIRRMATSWTRQPIYQESHNHRSGIPSIFLFARASLTDNGLVDAESMDFDLIFVRSRHAVKYNVPTTA